MASYDLLALGEVLLRLDPGEGRLHTSRRFTAWEGGGEYNVARGLRRCFGLSTGVLTALADNGVGRLIEDLILQGGVDTQFIKWVSYDGIGRAVRNPLNFTERGFGVRGATGCVDRGHSAASQLQKADFDWNKIFGEHKIKWLHTGGIFAGLSDGTADLALTACQAARKHGVMVSYDLNYRASLWQERGGFAAAQKINRRLAPHVDVMFGTLTESEATVDVSQPHPNDIFAAEAEILQNSISAMLAEFPNIKVAAATLRRVHTASRNDWGGLLRMGNTFYRSRNYPGLDLMDRIGGGDGFAAGLIFGMLKGETPQQTIDIAAAHGALAMTTPGDTSMATLAEVLQLAQASNAQVKR